MTERKNSLRITCYSLISLFTFGISPNYVYAAISPSDAVQAIQDAKVLPGDARVKVQLNKDIASVSTFLHDKDKADDLKIDAVLISRSIIEAPNSEIVRVNVYFYNSSLTNIKMCSVSAGDIKSFGEGHTQKEQLLRSLTIEDKSPAKGDDGSNISSYLEASRTSRADTNTRVSVTQDTMTVWSPIDAGMSERDCKIEGLRLAERAKQVAPANVKTIKICFTEPGPTGHERQMNFDQPRLAVLDSSMRSLLDEVKLSTNMRQPRTDDDGITASAGPLQNERKALLDRIKTLGKSGVGIKPFLNAFIAMEATVSTAPADKLAESVTRLSGQIDEQEKRLQAAKEFQPAKASTTVTAVTGTLAAPSCHATTPTTTKAKYSAPIEVTSGAESYPPQMAQQILADPTGAVSFWEKRYKHEGRNPDEYPAFIRVLDFTAQTLTNANRAQEAAVFSNRAKAGRELRIKNGSQ